MTIVRRAKRSDVGDIARLADQLAAAVADPLPRLSRAALEAALFGRSRWSECFLAVDGTVAVGYAIASRSFEAHTGKRQLRITDLFVSDDARRTGVGRELFGALATHARRLQCHELLWEVWRSNAPAYAFYERLNAHHADDISTMRIELSRAPSASTDVML